jgi:hypothetical protein
MGWISVARTRGSKLPRRAARILAQRSSDRPRGRPGKAHYRRQVRHSRLPGSENDRALIRLLSFPVSANILVGSHLGQIQLCSWHECEVVALRIHDCFSDGAKPGPESFTSETIKVHPIVLFLWRRPR